MSRADDRDAHGASFPDPSGRAASMPPMQAEPHDPVDAVAARAGCSFEAFLGELLDEADGYRGWQPSAEQTEELEHRLRDAWNAWRRDILHRAA
jgi:hypothetical protein